MIKKIVVVVRLAITHVLKKQLQCKQIKKA